MARRRAAAALVTAALVVAGGVAWVLLGSPGPRAPSAPASGQGAARVGTRAGAHDGLEEERAAAGSGSGLPPAGAPADDGGGAPHAAAAGAAADPAAVRAVVAVTDTSLPLAGVRLDWDAGELADDDPGVKRLVDRNGNALGAAAIRALRADGMLRREGTAVTDADGRASLPAAATSVLVRHPHAHLVRTEGTAAAVPPPVRGAAPAPVRLPLAPGTDALGLVFHDADGLVQVLLRDALTGAAIRDVRGVRIEWIAADGRRWRADLRDDPRLGGWIALDEEFLGETLTEPLDAATTRVEFSAPGYGPKRVPMTDLRGRVEIPLDPATPSARGTLVIGPGLDADLPATAPWRDGALSVVAEIRPVGEGAADRAAAARDARGVPTGEGPFAVHDLPDGAYVMEIVASLPSSVARATRTFEVRAGATADLGSVVLRAGAAVRARVLDAAGRPVPQADVVVVRTDEDPLEARRLDPDPDGWVVYADLAPATDHRAVVLGLPTPMERPVRTPDRAGKTETVEFRWTATVVDCRFRFTLEGRPLLRPTALRETPVRDSRVRWLDEGTLAVALLPGRHRFAIDVQYADGSPAGLHGASVDVPDAATFSATLALEAAAEAGR